MLQVISSDFSRFKAETTASEAKAVEEFKSFKTDTEAVLMQFKSKLKNAEQSFAEAKETLASAEALDTETALTVRHSENFYLTESINDLRVCNTHTYAKAAGSSDLQNDTILPTRMDKLASVDQSYSESAT